MPFVSFRRVLNLALHPLPAALTAVLLSLLIFDAFPADSVFYHLPFSVRFLGVPGFPDFTGYLEGRYQGFPVLWRFLMGPGLFLNQPRLFILPNLFALGLLVYFCRRLLRLPIALVICSCLAFPVALYGFRASVQDFYVNAMALIASLALFQPSAGFDSEKRKPCWIGGWDLIGLVCLAMAANIKFQGLFLAITIIAAAIVFRCIDIRLQSTGSMPLRKSQAVVTLALILLIFFQPLLNISRFGNPFYPVSFLGLPGPEARIPSAIPYIPKFPFLSNSLSYVVSVLEIDPVIRTKDGIAFTRSWNNHNLPKPGFEPVYPNYSWIVTGGSNGLLFLTLFIGAVLSVSSFGRRVPLIKTPLLILRRRLLLGSLLPMFLPQSMELRYYMISLFVPALVAVSGEATRLRQLMRWLVVAGVWIAMYPDFLQPVYFWIRTGEWISARGLMSPDLYSLLPSLESCQEKFRQWGGQSPTGPHQTVVEFQKSLVCHFRLLQHR